MEPHQKDLTPEGIARMERDELIRTLLAFNTRRTFQFTLPWLKRQWSRRLRSLLRAVAEQYPDARNVPEPTCPQVVSS